MVRGHVPDWGGLSGQIPTRDEVLKPIILFLWETRNLHKLQSLQNFQLKTLKWPLFWKMSNAEISETR